MFKKIFLIFFLSSFLLHYSKPEEEGRWAKIDRILTPSQDYSFLNVKWLDNESDPANPATIYGWSGSYMPSIRGGNIIPAGKDVKIKPQEEFSGLILPQKITSGLDSEKRIQVKGICEKKEMEITPGQMVTLAPTNKNGLLLLKEPINDNKSVSFWFQSSGDLYLYFYEKIGEKPLFQAKIGQDEISIQTNQELNQNVEQDFIKYGDTVYLLNTQLGQILRFNLENKTVKADPKINKDLSSWKILPLNKDLSFLENGAHILLHQPNGYLSAVGYYDIKMYNYWDRGSYWKIKKISSDQDSRIKNGDTIQLSSKWQNEFLAVEPHGQNLVKHYDQSQNNSNYWKIYLVKTPKKEKTYSYITKQDNPEAMASSGFDGTYSINIKNNGILISKSYQPGQNIVLYRKLPSEFAGKINFLSFTSDKDSINLANVIVAPPIIFSDSVSSLDKTSRVVYKAYSDVTENETYALRSSKQGSFEIEIKALQDTFINFYSDKDCSKLEYKIKLGIEDVTINKSLNKKISQVAKYKYYENETVSDDTFYKYKISINDGIFKIDRDEQTILIWQDQNPAIKCNYFKIQSNGKSECKNLNILPGEEISYETGKEYKQTSQILKENRYCQLRQLFFYDYYLQHSKYSFIVIDNNFTKKSYPIAPLPFVNREHNFIFEVKNDGNPEARFSHDPLKSAGEVALDIISETLIQSGKEIAQIPDPTGGVMYGIGIGSMVAGITATAIQKAAYAPVKGIYTEEVRIESSEVKEISEVAANNIAIESLINELKNIDLSNSSNLKIAIDNMLAIFDKIIAPGNAQAERRKYLQRKLDEIFEGTMLLLPDNLKENLANVDYKIQQAIFKTCNNLINLLINAYTNVNFLNPTDKKTESDRNELYREINILFAKLYEALKSDLITELKLSPFYGRAFFIPEQISNPEKWEIRMVASGQQDIIIGVHSEKAKISKLGRAVDLYIAGFGLFSNTISGICSNSNLLVEEYKTKQDNPELMAQQLGDRTYYFSRDGNVLECGFIDNKGKKRSPVKWIDPHPLANTIYPFVSSYYAPINIKSIEIIE